MLVIFESIFPVFAVMVLGYSVRKLGMIASANWKVIEDLCFWLLFPALLVMFIAKADFSTLTLGPLVFAILAFTLAMGLLTLSQWPVLKTLLGTTPAQFSTVYQTTTRWHGFIALIIALNMFGDASAPLMAIILAMMTIIIQISNLFVLAIFASQNRPSITGVLLLVAKNPIIASITIGLIINFLQIPLWPPLESGLDLLGRAALGLSLLAMGAGLSVKAVFQPTRELLIGVFGKLIVSPLVMLGIALWLNISGITLSVLILCASVPTAVNGYLFAKKMGGDAELYAATSTAQTLLSFATIPVAMYIAQLFGGF